MYYEINENEFSLNSNYYFNILIMVITIPMWSQGFLPDGVMQAAYLDSLTLPRPYAFIVCRDPLITDRNIEFEYELFPHCVVEITKQEEVRWYEMVDFETKDAWDITPILEDFDYDDEDASDD